MLYRAPMSDADLLNPPETSPFRERFDIDRVKRHLVASGEFNEKQAHHIAHDLYEIDKSYERMFYALRRGILPKLEAGDVDGAMEALIMYQVWLQHLTSARRDVHRDGRGIGSNLNPMMRSRTGRQNPASQADATLDGLARNHRRAYFAIVHGRVALRG